MNQSSNIGDSPGSENSGGLSLNDIYYVAFRRKWIILLFSLLGIVAAGAIFVHRKPVYRSDAKLLVRYVVESKSLVPPGDNSQVRQPDSGGSTIINSEIEILTSADLCVRVAEAVGSATILKNVNGGDDKFVAGAVISKGIMVEVPPRSNIIKISFRHPDPDIVKPVLERLIDEYLTRHAEIHRGLGSLDITLSEHADRLRFQLNQTEEKLRELKAKAGVISLEETKKAYTEEKSNLRRELFNAEAALAEARAAISLTVTNGATASNAVSIGKVEGVELEVPLDIIAQYKDVAARLHNLRENEFSLRLRYSDDNSLVKLAREQVAGIEKQKKDLEQSYPGLLRVKVSVPTVAATDVSASELQRERVVSLEAKVKTIKGQLESVRAEAAKLDEIETELKQLQRKRDIEEANFRYVSAGLERSRFDETLGASRNANINVIQNPTLPRNDDTKRLKMVAVALGGGLAAGMALAFLLEILLDQTVRRTHEVEGRLRLPLFMAIPYVNGKSMRKLAPRKKKRLTANSASESETPLPPATAWELNHPLRPMFEGLRDRMVHHFRNVVHKPKLVGISTCSGNAGATTVAAGLAAALSETGEGKVLLVDLHQPQGAAHPFLEGKPACEITDVLEQEKREAGMVQENLYMALAKSVADRRVGLLAKQLSMLVPKFKASDYDYIIFDMPRVSAISPTLRLAGMMDLTLLVVEAEKVPRESVKQAYSLLMSTGSEAKVILNKVRSYVPARLAGEL